VVEIVWPLFLFIILFLVRLRGLKKFHHECNMLLMVMMIKLALCWCWCWCWC
jgi:hypothetical protein